MSPLLNPCPNEAEHTPEPQSYLAWHNWADEKNKTHRQIRCSGCGRFKIWVLRNNKAARALIARGGSGVSTTQEDEA